MSLSTGNSHQFDSVTFVVNNEITSDNHGWDFFLVIKLVEVGGYCFLLLKVNYLELVLAQKVSNDFPDVYRVLDASLKEHNDCNLKLHLLVPFLCEGVVAIDGFDVGEKLDLLYFSISHVQLLGVNLLIGPNLLLEVGLVFVEQDGEYLEASTKGDVLHNAPKVLV